MANTKGEKELKRAWPHESGLELTDKHEGRQSNLVPQGHLGVKSLVRRIDKYGL